MRSRLVLVFSLCFVSAWRICDAQIETKTFVAYSMNVAQERVEAAITADEDFRKKQPDLYYLGGITRPWAVVIDTNNCDWILVGERDPKSSVLTLDDWVVALRARFIHPEKDPGVTIDPRPCEECFKTGKRESCSHYMKQDVRFFGGIEDTHFGQVCYEADWLMKRIGLGLEKLPIEKLKTFYALSVEQHRNSGAIRSRIGSRFWFYPIVNRVNVFSDVVLLEKFEMGVFTEILYAEVDSRSVPDIERFEHFPSEGFSRSFSENYNEAAQSKEVLETLRGLTRLAALAKGLTQIDSQSELNFFLIDYPFDKSRTPKEAEVLRVQNYDVGFEISGGVDLMALAMRVKGGDTGALKDLLIGTRIDQRLLTWEFNTAIQNGRLVAVGLPLSLVDSSEIVLLLQQGIFLQKKNRYNEAIECFKEMTKLEPDCMVAYLLKADTFYLDRQFYKAKEELTQAICLDPTYSDAYIMRGIINFEMFEQELGIMDLDHAIKLNPFSAQAYFWRALLYLVIDEHMRAMQDLEKVLELGVEDLFADEETCIKTAVSLLSQGLSTDETMKRLSENDLCRSDEETSKRIFDLVPIYRDKHARAFIGEGYRYAGTQVVTYHIQTVLGELPKTVTGLVFEPISQSIHGVIQKVISKNAYYVSEEETILANQVSLQSTFQLSAVFEASICCHTEYPKDANEQSSVLYCGMVGSRQGLYSIEGGDRLAYILYGGRVSKDEYEFRLMVLDRIPVIFQDTISANASAFIRRGSIIHCIAKRINAEWELAVDKARSDFIIDRSKTK